MKKAKLVKKAEQKSVEPSAVPNSKTKVQIDCAKVHYHFIAELPDVKENMLINAIGREMDKVCLKYTLYKTPILDNKTASKTN